MKSLSYNSISHAFLLLLTLVFLVVIPLAVNSSTVIRPLENIPFFTLAIGSTILGFIVLLKSFSALRITLRWVDVVLLIFLVYRLWHAISYTGFYASRHVAEFMLLAVLYLVFRSIAVKDHISIIYVLILGAIVQAVYGQLQLYGAFPSQHSLYNITGNFFNPAPFAGYLVSVFPVALLLYLKGKGQSDHSTLKNTLKIVPWFLSLLCLILIVIVLPATRSRAAWLSVLLVSAFISMRHHSYGRDLISKLKGRRKHRLLRFVMLGVLFIVGLLAIYYLKKDSADGRLLIWQIASQMVLEKPLLGYGENGFEAFYMQHQASFFSLNPDHAGIALADNVQYAYNEIVKLMVEYGLIALLLGGLLTCAVVKTKGKDVALVAAKYGLLALVVFSCFSYPSDIIAIKVHFVLFLAIVGTHSRVVFQVHQGKWIRSFAVVLMLFFLFLAPKGIKHLQDYHAALVSWRDASDIYRVEAYEESLDDFEAALPVLKQDGDFLIQYGKALTMAGQYDEAIHVLEDAKNYLNNTILYTALGDSYAKTGDYTQAEETYWQAYWMVPSRFYPLYLLAQMYEASGAYDKALEMVQMIDGKPVKIESRAIEEIREEMHALEERINQQAISN